MPGSVIFLSIGEEKILMDHYKNVKDLEYAHVPHDC
jgi:hypothetical protein